MIQHPVSWAPVQKGEICVQSVVKLSQLLIYRFLTDGIIESVINVVSTTIIYQSVQTCSYFIRNTHLTYANNVAPWPKVRKLFSCLAQLSMYFFRS